MEGFEEYYDPVLAHLSAYLKWLYSKPQVPIKAQIYHSADEWCATLLNPEGSITQVLAPTWRGALRAAWEFHGMMAQEFAAWERRDPRADATAFRRNE